MGSSVGVKEDELGVAMSGSQVYSGEEDWSQKTLRQFRGLRFTKAPLSRRGY